MQEPINKNYLRGIDGLRCVASFIVLFHHIEGRKGLVLSGSFKTDLLNTGIAQATMTLFFVISGFVISYTLFNEKKKSGTISVWAFYKRRALRVWPVYYVVFLSVILLLAIYKPGAPLLAPKVASDYNWVVLIYLLHMPELYLFFASAIKPVMHFWSLGVEEKFYLAWPWLLKRKTGIVKACIAIIAIKVLLKLGIAACARFLPMELSTYTILKTVERYLFLFRIEAMATGTLAAWLFLEAGSLQSKVQNKLLKDILEFVYKPVVQWVNILLMLLCMPLSRSFEFIHIFLMFQVAIIVLNCVGNTRSVIDFDNRVMNYLGKISYGVYIYQFPIILGWITWFVPFYNSTNRVAWHFGLYFACISCTLVLAALSYALFEKKIMLCGRKK